jgi:Xaa-Pro aminopeptidase
MHERIMQIRFQRSQEEANIYREGAALADGGFGAAVKFIRAGVSEYEIVAEIERYVRARGAEENFTLITSGKFAFGDANRLPRLHSPSDRRIEIGDTVEFEITPRYEGYWTQLARKVNVGKPNHDLEKINKTGCNAIKKGLEQFKPGKTVAAVASAIELYVANCGYQLGSSMGHICGIDLVESRIDSQNQMKLSPGTAVIVHPRLFTPDGNSSSFWGETYLVTQDGYERLNHVGDEVMTL